MANEVKGNLQFNEMLYSEIGEDIDVTNNKISIAALESVGDVRHMVNHAVRIITKLTPWHLAKVQKYVGSLEGRSSNQVYTKFVTINLSDIYEVGNEELTNCFNWICGMLINPVDDYTYSIWCDAMSEKRYSIERYNRNEKSGTVNSITFRFIVMKYNGVWKQPDTEVSVKRSRPAETLEEQQEEFAAAEENKPVKKPIKKPVNKNKSTAKKPAKKPAKKVEAAKEAGDAGTNEYTEDDTYSYKLGDALNK